MESLSSFGGMRKAASHMPDVDRRIVKALLEGMIVKYQTKRMVGNLSS